MDELENEQSIVIQKKGAAYLIENIEQASNKRLNEEELDFIQKVCEKWKGKRTEDIVKFTHNQIPWSVAREEEVIPYELITQEDPSNVY